jgi:translation initiation factor 3 subunit C
MSFFARLGSDSDSDSGSESEESILSGDEGERQDAAFAGSKPKGRASQFLRSDGSDSSSEEEDSDDDDSDDEDAKPVGRVATRRECSADPD